MPAHSRPKDGVLRTSMSRASTSLPVGNVERRGWPEQVRPWRRV